MFNIALFFVVFFQGDDRIPVIESDEIFKYVSIYGNTTFVNYTCKENSRVWKKQFSNPNKDIVALHFSFKSKIDTSASWVITIKSNSSSLEFRPKDLQLENGGFWMPNLSKESVEVIFSPNKTEDNIHFVIDKIIRYSPTSNQESHVGPPNFEKVSHVSSFLEELGRPVVKLTFIKDGQAFVCSGFQIAPGIIMTNDHCVNSKWLCQSTAITFGFYGQGEVGMTTECIDYLGGDSDLDYSLLRIKPHLEWSDITTFSPNGISDNTKILIIQHPSGRSQEICRDSQCFISESEIMGLIPDADFSHECDTEGGSSGSPVFLQDGSVIGLHHFGYSNDHWFKKNRAVRIDRILDHLRVNNEEIYNSLIIN